MIPSTDDGEILTLARKEVYKDWSGDARGAFGAEYHLYLKSHQRFNSFGDKIGYSFEPQDIVYKNDTSATLRCTPQNVEKKIQIRF